MPEAQEEGHENQDNADVHKQAWPEVMPEEEDVHADDCHRQSKDIQHRDSASGHLTNLSAWLQLGVTGSTA